MALPTILQLKVLFDADVELFPFPELLLKGLATKTNKIPAKTITITMITTKTIVDVPRLNLAISKIFFN